MEIYSEIIGNIYTSPEWATKIKDTEIETINLDQWDAQKSRILIKGDKGNEYPIALKRNSHVINGDIIYYSSAEKKSVVIKIDLSPVLVIDLSEMMQMDPKFVVRSLVELGHAIGNQHWPAVVKNSKIYVPLTVEEKVMTTVIDTHYIEGISYTFEKGQDILAFLSPQEIRRLFGGASHDVFAHGHGHNHSHAHGHGHEHHHPHEHTHAEGHHSHKH